MAERLKLNAWSKFVLLLILALCVLAVCTYTRAGELTVTFTAPGDDDTLGTATAYRIYIDTLPLDTFVENELPLGSYWSGCAPTGPHGTPETCRITGLIWDRVYYLRAVALDKAGNSGAASNQINRRAVDVTVPSIIILNMER